MFLRAEKQSWFHEVVSPEVRGLGMREGGEDEELVLDLSYGRLSAGEGACEVGCIEVEVQQGSGRKT